MERAVDGDSSLAASFCFPPDFTGFQGHFPSNSVLPGACQIQAVICTIEKGLNSSLLLKKIILAKYFAPVFPDEKIDCAVSVTQAGDGTALYKARISRGGEKVSEIRIEVAVL